MVLSYHCSSLIVIRHRNKDGHKTSRCIRLPKNFPRQAPSFLPHKVVGWGWGGEGFQATSRARGNPGKQGYSVTRCRAYHLFPGKKNLQFFPASRIEGPPAKFVTSDVKKNGRTPGSVLYAMSPGK